MFTDHIQIKGKYSVDCDCLKTNKSVELTDNINEFICSWYSRMSIILEENKMAKFIKACKCPRCGKICKSDGTTYDLITEGNAILLNDFSYEEWHCDECDIDFHHPNNIAK